MKGINAKIEDFYEDKGVEGTYGEVWSTNANDSTAPNKITSTNNRWAPTIFAYEDVDPSNGISDGYSDAKITTYNLSTTGTTFWLSSRIQNTERKEILWIDSWKLQKNVQSKECKEEKEDHLGQ